MTVSTQYVEEYDAYELVDEIEGVPVVFARLEGSAVRAHIENVKATEEQSGTTGSGQQS